MDLQLTGKTALIAASSRGLGFAIADALSREGANVIINGRFAEPLEHATELLRSRYSTRVDMVVADLNRPEERERLIAACPHPDILVTNNGGPAPTKFADTTPAVWADALEAQLLAAIQLIHAVLPGMRERHFGRIINITSAMVTSPHPMMTLSTVPRAGLTALAKALSREVAADNVTINNILPERIDTDRQKYMVARQAEERGESEEVTLTRITSAIPALRFGRPEEVADTCAFLCATQAGFITGQNLHLDGGAYEGLI